MNMNNFYEAQSKIDESKIRSLTRQIIIEHPEVFNVKDVSPAQLVSALISAELGIPVYQTWICEHDNPLNNMEIDIREIVESEIFRQSEDFKTFNPFLMLENETEDDLEFLEMW